MVPISSKKISGTCGADSSPFIFHGLRSEGSQAHFSSSGTLTRPRSASPHALRHPPTPAAVIPPSPGCSLLGKSTECVSVWPPRSCLGPERNVRAGGPGGNFQAPSPRKEASALWCGSRCRCGRWPHLVLLAIVSDRQVHSSITCCVPGAVLGSGDAAGSKETQNQGQ